MIRGRAAVVRQGHRARLCFDLRAPQAFAVTGVAPLSSQATAALALSCPVDHAKTMPLMISRRYLSSTPPPSPPPPDNTDFSKLRRLEDANPERIHGIQVNPDGIGSTVLPGNLVYKYYKWTGNTRKVPLELVHGYFWMLNDLKATNAKPTLSNETLIPEEGAQTFPMLTGLESLSREPTDLPYFFIANKGTKWTRMP